MSDIHSVIKMIMGYMIKNSSVEKPKSTYINKINISKSDSDLFAKMQINDSLERKYSNRDLNLMYSKYINKNPNQL